MSDTVEALVASLSLEDRKSLARLLVKGTGSYVVPQALLTMYVPTYELVVVDGFDLNGLPQDKSHLKPTAKTPDEHPAITLTTFLNAKHPGHKYSTKAISTNFSLVVRNVVLNSHGVAYCFVDLKGNIYQPAGWYAHEKGIRSTVNSVLNEFTLTDSHGAWLFAKHFTAS